MKKTLLTQSELFKQEKERLEGLTKDKKFDKDLKPLLQKFLEI
jgi:hypothetical protein